MPEAVRDIKCMRIFSVWLETLRPFQNIYMKTIGGACNWKYMMECSYAALIDNMAVHFVSTFFCLKRAISIKLR